MSNAERKQRDVASNGRDLILRRIEVTRRARAKKFLEGTP